MTELRASVRQVVEFSLHERDLSPAAFAAKRMREGAAAHKARQSVGAREETAYQAEKSLSADYAAREITLRVLFTVVRGSATERGRQEAERVREAMGLTD